MSLSLLQGYSSAEEEEDDEQQLLQEEISSDDEENDAVPKTTRSYKPLFDPNPASSSALPSAFDAFSEISGPPQFLNNSVQGDAPKEDVPRWRHGRKRNRKEKQDLPAVRNIKFVLVLLIALLTFLHFGIWYFRLFVGAVVESKAHLVGIHERVRSDVENNASGSVKATAQGGKRVATVGNPSAEDAAELLRMCVRCGIPKTYSHAKGIVCPACGDLPPVDSDKESTKKKGSMVKDKEKSKRMKGQSSHATWKSETEMQLRQQFD
ncbi:hypothetical protein BUALT_Bualt19G0095200 [Buddleja alternifolia]|uniref:Uncharacterized protein n=1 Tax=Buddleja alternifolia TaxID=168488 RepID=A0AAV6W320_9LAMI|nr:hypothetical protein BUALT_Bualt19G0095200 [Buddleja alternifolia]